MLALTLALATAVPPTSWAQVADAPAASQVPDSADTEPGLSAEEPSGLNFLDLLMMGRYWMLPILFMSLIVGTFSFERLIGLRGSRVLPRRLVSKLNKMATGQLPFDAQDAYSACDAYPSVLARITRATLVKIGRPHAEVELTMREASEREATRMHANVRWLSLAAAVTPLMGLLGTVWGMIRAFHDTTQLAPGQNKADHLAEGIYIALVTTLAGLAVAIPAAILAHYFEGRIQAALLRAEELLVSLMPHVEKYEGQGRFGTQGNDDPSGQFSARIEAPPVQTPASPVSN